MKYLILYQRVALSMVPKYLLVDERVSCLKKKIFSEMLIMKETPCLEAAMSKPLSPRIFTLFNPWS